MNFTSENLRTIMVKEACVGNLISAINAKKHGAHQIELCDRLDLDGISPPIKLIESICEKVDIPIKVIVNPKPYNYVYSKKDINAIIAYIGCLNDLPIQGIVFGPLLDNGTPDLKAIQIASECTSLPITYHKAIDTSNDITKSLTMLIEQNIVKFILSSGGARKAESGIHQLLQMKNQLDQSQIQLIAAGKIDNYNLDYLHSQLNLSYYHGKKIVGNLKSSY